MISSNEHVKISVLLASTQCLIWEKKIERVWQKSKKKKGVLEQVFQNVLLI